jgi:hypothetical protein
MMARNNYNIDSIDGNSYKNIIVTVIVVLVIAVLFYLLTIYIINKPDKVRVTEGSISYEQISAGSTFNMSDKKYLVIFYNRDNSGDITTAVSNYKSKDKALPIYYVDYNDAINASVTSKDSSNPKATKASELKVKNPTLIEISNGSISQYIEGEEKVIDYLS